MVKEKQPIIKFSDTWKLYGTIYDWQFYHHKPTIIRAIQMDEPFSVKTSEGVMEGKKGDYLIEGTHKELYICKKEIFKEIYKKV